MGIVWHLHMDGENRMGARLNARLETLDIDDVFFETTDKSAEMSGSMGLPQGLENVMQSLTKGNNVESWEVMSHVQSDTTNVFIKFQKKVSRALVLLLPRGEVSLFTFLSSIPYRHYNINIDDIHEKPFGIPYSSRSLENEPLRCCSHWVKVCLHISIPSSSKFNIVSTVTDRMGNGPILPVQLPITVNTVLNFDSDGVGMCKQTLTVKRELELQQTLQIMVLSRCGFSSRGFRFQHKSGISDISVQNWHRGFSKVSAKAKVASSGNWTHNTNH